MENCIWAPTILSVCTLIIRAIGARRKQGSEKKRRLEGINLSYIGDGNNVANSLMICGALLGVNVKICSPNGFEADPKMVDKAKSLSKFGAKISISNDPSIAVMEAQVIYTDVWASMGQEEEKLKRKEIFENYKVNQKLIGLLAVSWPDIMVEEPCENK